MKPKLSIFLAVALLLASSGVEAARRTSAGSTNPMLPPPSPFSLTPLTPHTNPIGGAGTGQNFGALPGNPGSPTFDPNSGTLNNPGSALAPLPGTPGSALAPMPGH